MGELDFLLMDIILFFTLIGFTLVVFDLNSIGFVLQFIFLLVFIFLLAFGMYLVYNDEKSGGLVISVTLFVLLVDTILIIAFARIFGIRHAITIVFSLIGLALPFLNLIIEREYYPEPELSEQEKYYGI